MCKIEAQNLKYSNNYAASPKAIYAYDVIIIVIIFISIRALVQTSTIIPLNNRLQLFLLPTFTYHAFKNTIFQRKKLLRCAKLTDLAIV